MIFHFAMLVIPRGCHRSGKSSELSDYIIIYILYQLILKTVLMILTLMLHINIDSPYLSLILHIAMDSPSYHWFSILKCHAIWSSTTTQVVHLGSGMQAPEGWRRKWLGVGATAQFKNIAWWGWFIPIYGEFIWIYMDLYGFIWICHMIPSGVFLNVAIGNGGKSSTNYCWWMFQPCLTPCRLSSKDVVSRN